MRGSGLGLRVSAELLWLQFGVRYVSVFGIRYPGSEFSVFVIRYPGLDRVQYLASNFRGKTGFGIWYSVSRVRPGSVFGIRYPELNRVRYSVFGTRGQTGFGIRHSVSVFDTGITRS